MGSQRTTVHQVHGFAVRVSSFEGDFIRVEVDGPDRLVVLEEMSNGTLQPPRGQGKEIGAAEVLAAETAIALHRSALVDSPI